MRAWGAAAALTSCLMVLVPGAGAGASTGRVEGTGNDGSTVPSPVCRPRTAPVASGPATLMSEQTIAGTGGRGLDITLYSPAMDGPEHVDVLLPRHYDGSGTTRYPVLYLLHGAGGSYQDWIDHGVEADIDYTSVADHVGPFITVMPDGGAWGFYSNWYGTDLQSGPGAQAPAWETFHIDELIPWIDAHFPVISSRSGRAIAGLSMGGFGAMSYAAQYPDLFAAAGSFSGVTDIDLDYPAGNEALSLLSAYFVHGLPDQCIWGDPLTQGVRWHGADPTYLAGNLAQTSLFVASGNGKPGPYDTPGTTSTETDGAVESLIYALNQGFTAALSADGIPYTGYFYGPGTHSWGYWLRDLAHFLPQMWGVFSAPDAASGRLPFDFSSVDTTFGIHGYTFAVDHTAEAFTYVRGVGANGFTAVGTGTLSVTTPPLYAAGQSYLVRAGSSRRTVRAGAGGQLSFSVDLGPPSPVQQTDFDGSDPNGYPDLHVSIAPVAAPA